MGRLWSVKYKRITIELLEPAGLCVLYCVCMLYVHHTDTTQHHAFTSSWILIHIGRSMYSTTCQLVVYRVCTLHLNTITSYMTHQAGVVCMLYVDHTQTHITKLNEYTPIKYTYEFSRNHTIKTDLCSCISLH
jgi:hypothetical protein